MKAKGIRENGEVVYFDVIDGVLNCCYNRLTELEVPQGVVILDCCYNRLTELEVPQGVFRLYCSHNKLTELEVPNGVVALNCSHNKLTELIVPQGVEFLDCSHNRFENDATTFINPKTDRVVFFQNDLFYCGCCCGKTKAEFKTICDEKGFSETIEHFGL